jgi:hypothetical protein
VGISLGWITDRPASSIRPRTMRAPIWSENPAQRPTALNEPAVKKRRREKLLFFNYLQNQIIKNRACIIAGIRSGARGK